MADERGGTREFDTRKTLSWTELLRTFLIALDPFKLLVAAAGILVTAIGWWFISVIFYGAWTEKNLDDPVARQREIKDRTEGFVKDGKDQKDAEARAATEYDGEANRFKFMKDNAGPGGAYRTMPWFEDRGRNPYFVAKDAITSGSQGRDSAVSWFFSSQIAVLIEPLLKFLKPVFNLFDSSANFWIRVYLIFLILWILIVWAFFGGVITRMAVVQIAGKEGGGLRDSIRFVRARYLSYLFSPIVPIGLIFAVVLGLIFYGIFHVIPGFGDVVDGFFWWIPLGAGFVMALLVVGLVGYPLMYTTLSSEGSDTFDALSRSYNYVYESPWHYVWYGFVSAVYGAALVLFVVCMSTLLVYLGKWGVSQTPFTQSLNRSPEFLFVYSPTSFGWRETMLRGSPVEITSDINKAGKDPAKRAELEKQLQGYRDKLPTQQEREQFDKTVQQFRENADRSPAQPQPMPKPEEIEKLAKQLQSNDAGERIQAQKQLEQAMNSNVVEQTRGYYYVDPERANYYMTDKDKGFWYSTHFAAGMVGFWVTLIFMMMLGFSYSFFWTQASMIYLLMRKKVDEVEVDEIYTEDEDFEEPVAPPKLSSQPSGPATIPVDAPTLRVPPPPAAPVPPAAPPTDSAPAPTIMPEPPPPASGPEPTPPPTDSTPPPASP